MKLYRHILLVVLLSFCSCSPGFLEVDKEDEGSMVLTIYNTVMSTKANPETKPGDAHERLVEKLDIFFYPSGSNSGADLHVQRTALNDDDGLLKIPVYISNEQEAVLFPTSATSCDVFVIANLPDNMNLGASPTKDDLRNLIVSSDFSGVVASDGSFSVPGNFVMCGESVVNKANNGALSGTIALQRAACKITMKLWIPESLGVNVKDESGNPVKDEHGNNKVETWKPYFVNPSAPSEGINEMHMGFHKGVQNSYLDGREYEESPIFETGYTKAFVHDGEDSSKMTDASGKKFYLYSCEVSFYSYSRAWTAANDENAPYFTLMIPWVKEDDYTRYQTYYYQILVNGKSKQMQANKWYDIELTVNKLGSRVQNQAFELTDQATTYVLDWQNAHTSNSDGTSQEVGLKEWRYLVVPENRVEMNNTDKGSLIFDASHDIAWSLAWPGSMDGLDELEQFNADSPTPFASFYIDNNGKSPKAAELKIDKSAFSISPSGETLDFNYTNSQNIASPIYVHLKVWLDINPGGANPDSEEEDFVEYITFVKYPAIYIIPDRSTERSVYVNSFNGRSDDIKYGNYNLAKCPGTGDSEYMYIINISSLASGDKFEYHDDAMLSYLIGDPRIVGEPDVNLNNDSYSMTQHWVQASAVDGTQRKLTYYYPAASSGEVYRVIAPKFRISSSFGGNSRGCDKEGAAMRCASYQEDGFPAGRWRLPTTAEVLFVIGLQGQKQIQSLFYGGNSYFSSTDLLETTSSGGFDSYNTKETSGSVRCVYDEWYWGSDREATLNQSPTTGGNYPYFDKYKFTWGDEPRID